MRLIYYERQNALRRITFVTDSVLSEGLSFVVGCPHVMCVRLRCAPCQRIAPHFATLSNTYAADAVFLKVDIDEAREVAQQYNVTAVPTFIFFRGGERLFNMRGCNPTTLETKITELLSRCPEVERIQTHGDLAPFIAKQNSECLNESDNFNLAALLEGKAHLESDCDEQLLISIGFQQPVKLHSFRMTGPSNAAKTVCIFINQPHTLDFDSASSMKPVQVLELSPKDAEKDAIVELKFVKFQNVSNLQLFIKDNQDGSEVTRIDKLQFFGSALSSTNMSDFKRVTGKKGEAH
ncbi:thioredoxin-like protein 1 isoform X1 [Varroa destructor]|uniref:PITH domain-containing protein n=1 Tax=Varroa destructor TaxID=109461 RepID=A0A7M7KC39_VARDE|nr:thioredoxin-like protein 1 isoform X1 [Varroa destructor]